MGQRQREQVQRGCAVGTMVLLAWLCRVLPLEGMPSGLQEACGILRSLLYLSLFAGWGISLYNRTVHPQVRRLLLNVDLLMLFWIIVRTLRFQLNTPPGMDRMLGYLYYAPMLGIPVLCVQLVLTVDRSERYRLSAWARMLWLPSAVLLELVLTNDLHQQVFRLQQPWNENYQYGWLFGLVVGWIVICILLAFGIIAHKSRNPRILRRLPLPAIPMVLLGVYAVLYGFHFPLIRQFLGDMTIVHCLMTAASLEGGLRCGLIQSNTGYEELLRVTSLAVQLVDRQGNVYCCSENGRIVDRRELQAAMHGTVQLDEHTLLRSAPVQGGYVMWQTDITELVENMEHLVEDSGRYRRVASLSTAEMALAQCARHAVDLVLMDVCTKGSRDGIDVAAEIKARYPETKVIIITSMVEESYLKRAKAAGAESFWYKDVSPESLLEVMDRTMAGESLYPDRTPETRLGQVSSTQLTPREIEVLRLVCEGLEYEEIAAELGISSRTVKRFVSSLLEKTGYSNRTRLAIAVTKKNFILPHLEEE